MRKRILGICIGLLAAGLLARLGLDLAEGYSQSFRQKSQLYVKWAHLKGWAAVSEKVNAQVQAVFGDSLENAGILEEVSRQARSLGLRIFELKPSENAAELALEGTASQIGSYLEGLSRHRPPLKIETVQLITQPKAEAPVTLRVRLEWPASGGIQK
ncbi:MAG: hypothetical protein HY594_04720 [Candidatus Omnitrophica bacterium]|nr:hypothetical protein [Candidatus Omnitrophota bacterium]